MDYVTNSKGLKIAIGAPVRYVGTGTIGVVKAIDLANGKYWALLDTTNLYYDVNYLEPIEKTEIKKMDKKSRPIKVKVKNRRSLKRQSMNNLQGNRSDTTRSHLSACT